MVISSQAATIPLIWKLGDTISVKMTWKAGTPPLPVDFTGCTAIAQIKADQTDTVPLEVMDVTLGNAANNIALSLSAVKCAALGVGKFYYDVQITQSDGTVRTFVDGQLKIRQDTSR